MKISKQNKTASAPKSSSHHHGKLSKSKRRAPESTPDSVCQGTRSKQQGNGNITSTNLLPRIDETVTVHRERIDIANVEVRHHKDASDEISDIEESQESQDLLEE
jgi:hypothetical protein